jgi:hypothetical protein
MWHSTVSKAVEVLARYPHVFDFFRRSRIRIRMAFDTDGCALLHERGGLKNRN